MIPSNLIAVYEPLPWQYKPPEFVRYFRAVDFGYSNPFVCQWWGMDADGRLYRYRVDVTSGGEKIKGYIGFTPEQWDKKDDDTK